MSENFNADVIHRIEKKGGKHKLIIIAAITAIVAVIAICLIASGTSQNIDLTEYVQINVSGFDGYAKATATVLHSDIDEKLREIINEKYGEDLNKAMDKYEDFDSVDMNAAARKYAKKYEELYEKMTGEYAAFSDLFETMECSLNKEELISNGDKLEATVSFSKEAEKALEDFGYKIKIDNIELIVADLEKGDAIDPFEYIDVKFEGASGYVKASITIDEKLNDKKENFIIKAGKNSLLVQYSESENSVINFSISSTEGLKNGEKLTVTAYSHNLRGNTILAKTEQEFTILVPEAFKTDEEVKKNLKSIYSAFADTKNSSTVQGSYILTAANDEAKYNNKVIAILKYETTGWFSQKYFYVAEINNCYKDSSGTVLWVDTTSHYERYSTKEEAFEGAKELIDSNYYTYTKN